MTVPGLLELPNCSSKQQVMRQQVEVSKGDGYFFGPAGRGLGGVQWGAEAAGSSRGVGGGGGVLEVRVLRTSGLRSNIQLEATYRIDMT